jgi:hypothetical protein
MSNSVKRLMRKFFALSILILCLVTLSLPPLNREAHADAACCATCDEGQFNCEQSCSEAFYPCGGNSCGIQLIRCRQACESQRNFCISNYCGGSCEL